ncbi:MAG: ArgE/DapE family deacylase [Gemmatimonadaceae bacterium]
MSSAVTAGRNRIARGDAVALTQALVQVDSRNPSLCDGAPGEAEVARVLGRVLEDWGFDVEFSDAAPGRPNVVARIGPADAPALMFAGHLDVVAIEGMTHAPFDARIRDGRIYGRGSCDMKAGIAAMCAGVIQAYDMAGPAKRQIAIVAVADEEYESLGMRALLASGVTAEAAVVTEPTCLAICPAHRGFAWIEVEFSGRAAHGSRYDIGIDAIRHAGLVLAELDELDNGGLTGITHPLLGRASLHAGTIHGGIGMNTYPDACHLTIERRTLPGESADAAMHEVYDACERVRARRPGLDAHIRLTVAQNPSDVAVDSPVVGRLRSALSAESVPVLIEGLSAWTDAALLNEAGIPAICFGPGNILLAHSNEEFVPVSEIEVATRVLGRVARDWLLETT